MTVDVVELRARQLRIPFKTVFRHAAAERSETASVWVEAVSGAGITGFGESCPRSYVTGETVEGALAFIASHVDELRDEVDSLAALRAWTASHRQEIDRHPAAWCAVELALIDLVGKATGATVEQLLGLPRAGGPFRYSAVIGDSPFETFAATAERYRRLGFTDFKIKLSPDPAADRRKLDLLAEWQADDLRVRVDANNLFDGADAAIPVLRELPLPLFAVEEPIPPNRYEELLRIAHDLGCRIVLDESLLRAGQLTELPGAPDRWVINVRVSKMGGVLRSVDLVERARTAGYGIIVGAQVGETSMLTRAALTVATAAGPALLAQEGAFGTHLLAHDICDPPLMFGIGGMLDPAGCVDRPGFGLPIIQPT